MQVSGLGEDLEHDHLGVTHVSRGGNGDIGALLLEKLLDVGLQEEAQYTAHNPIKVAGPTGDLWHLARVARLPVVAALLVWSIMIRLLRGPRPCSVLPIRTLNDAMTVAFSVRQFMSRLSCDAVWGKSALGAYWS